MPARNVTRGQNHKLGKKEIVAATRQVAVAKYHEGPVPDPITLKGYEEILPGAANRIIIMAEEQSKHRQAMEKSMLRGRNRDSLLGIIAGFLLAALTIVCGTYIILHGQTWSGTILGSAGLVGIVSVFIYGTRSNRKEREGKTN